MKPRLVISAGDPAGIGAEVVIKALRSASELGDHCCYILGDEGAFFETSRSAGLPFDIPVITLAQFRQHPPVETCLVDFGNVKGKISFGVESAENGRASMQYVEEGVSTCMVSNADALVTAPINKRAVNLAGFHIPGHTEYIASLVSAPMPIMSFYTSPFWTVLASTHLPLIQAVTHIKRDRLSALIRMVYQELRAYVERPSMAIAALNPHGGEGGLFGMEEEMEILPAVVECQQEGLPISGPFSADTLYLRAIRGDYNIVIALYHDQGMIPVKLLSFGKAVNVTLGLPFIRTSVDHGTAFDIAGKGSASSESMLEAIRLAIEMIDRRGSRAVLGS